MDHKIYNRVYIRQFGVPRVVNPKPILKTIPKLFAHTDKNVRAEVSYTHAHAHYANVSFIVRDGKL